MRDELPEDDASILRRHGIEPDPVIEAYKKDVDRTLLRENLRRTLEERFDNAMELQRFADELRRAGRTARANGG
jgi:3-hydroxyisobutyrate dehydrogenase-like beta-hydroxyacid dehydrogenase